MAELGLTPRRRRGLALLGTALTAGLILGGCASGGATEEPEGEAASYGEISVQYSWIKNEEFAGEFYAYENGYYDEAGFSEVIGIAVVIHIPGGRDPLARDIAIAVALDLDPLRERQAG